MAKSSYESALARVLAHEGGYADHRDDPGGPTNFGITIADYRRYVKADATAADVRAMSVDEAKAVYRRRYWDAQRCNELPAGVDYAVFDYGVNSGIGRSGRVLRRTLGLAGDTSTITDQVVTAARRADPRAVIAAICDERLRFLKSLKAWGVFGTGWSRRVAEVRAVALVMAETSGPRASVPAKAAGAAVAIGGAAAAAHHAGLPQLAVVATAAAAGLAIALGIHLVAAKRG